MILIVVATLNCILDWTVEFDEQTRSSANERREGRAWVR